MKKILIKGFLLTALVPVLLLSVTLCYISANSQIQQKLKDNSATLASLAWSVEARMSTVNALPIELPESNGFSSKLSVGSLYWLLLHCEEDGGQFPPAENYGDYIRISNDINRRYLRNENQYISGIYLITRNKGIMSFTSRGLLKTDKVEELWEHAPQGGLPRFLYGGENDIYHWRSDFVVHHSFSYLSEIRSIDMKDRLAVMVVDVNVKLFEPLSNHLQGEEGKEFYVLDRDGKAVYHSADADSGENYARYCGESASEYNMAAGEIICSYPLKEFQEMTLIYVERIGIYSVFGTILLMVTVIAVFAILYALYMTITYAHRFTAPIRKLCSCMEADERLPDMVSGHQDIYEFGILYKHYDKMIESIRQYIKEKYENELLMTQAKMKVMEAQIDSHFLYNTLECIQSMALVNGADDVADMSKSLADMFRYVSRMEEPVVQVREELKYVQDYLMIQRIRFGKDVSFLIKVEREYLDSYMLKLMLQPVVENIFKHGFREKQPVYNIHLTCTRSQGRLQFRICDNGVGMDPDTLTQVRQKIESGSAEGDSGVGLTNIAKRMRLYYGEEASMEIESIAGEGTMVYLAFPERGL